MVALDCCDGVPVIAPVDVFKLNPVGNAACAENTGAAQLAVATACEYATPTVGLGSVVVVMAQGAGDAPISAHAAPVHCLTYIWRKLPCLNSPQRAVGC